MKKEVLKVIAILGLMVVFFCIIMPQLIYNINVLPGFPGEQDVWMGFWASFSGTMATVTVAYLTWRNSASISELQEEYLRLNTGANLRLSKVEIVPLFKKGCMSEYDVAFVFDNFSKSVVQKIEIEKGDLRVSMGGRQNISNSVEWDFKLRANQPALIGRLSLEKTPIKSCFGRFCFYYSQFPTDTDTLVLKTEMQVFFGNHFGDPGKKKRFELIVELMPEPVIDEDSFCFKISRQNYYVKPYKWSIVNYHIRDMTRT